MDSGSSASPNVSSLTPISASYLRVCSGTSSSVARRVLADEGVHRSRPGTPSSLESAWTVTMVTSPFASASLTSASRSASSTATRASSASPGPLSVMSRTPVAFLAFSAASRAPSGRRRSCRHAADSRRRTAGSSRCGVETPSLTPLPRVAELRLPPPLGRTAGGRLLRDHGAAATAMLYTGSPVTATPALKTYTPSGPTAVLSVIAGEMSTSA